MAEVKIEDDQLLVRIKGIRRFAALKKELRIPLSQVRGATADSDLSTGWPGITKTKHWPGMKIRGTDLYGHYLGGIFSQDGDRVFWDVRDPKKAIVISLSGSEFIRLIVDVNDAVQTVSELEAALRR